MEALQIDEPMYRQKKEDKRKKGKLAHPILIFFFKVVAKLCQMPKAYKVAFVTLNPKIYTYLVVSLDPDLIRCSGKESASFM